VAQESQHHLNYGESLLSNFTNMSRSRGIFPLFLATTFGVVNGMKSSLFLTSALKTIPGVWIFGPAFKEQQELKDEQAR
jgi:hypothetical protein